MIVAPSFLTADFTRIEAEIKSIASAKWLHFDVMDGLFVPNRTYDETMLRQLRSQSDQFFDCHLMIVEPYRQARAYIEAGADLVTFHYEAAQGLIDETISLIINAGCKVGISIKPNTDPMVLAPYLARLDLVLIMSVEPGKGGQRFREEALAKIRYLADHKRNHGNKYLIEVDGGINADTVQPVKEAGADVIVVGSYLFNQTDRARAIEAMENV